MSNAILNMVESMLKQHNWVEESIGIWTHVNCDLYVDLNSAIAMVRSESNSSVQMLDMDDSTPIQAKRFIDEISNW